MGSFRDYVILKLFKIYLEVLTFPLNDYKNTDFSEHTIRWFSF